MCLTCFINKMNNIVKDLHNRQLGVTNTHRFTLKILQKLIFQENATYKKLWETHSKKTIYYDSHKIYLNNYRTCFTVCGYHGQPSILYELPHVNSSEVIKDSLCCQINPAEPLPLDGENFRPCFLALTAHGWMYRLHLETGRMLQEMYLSTVYCFRHISWETHGHSVVLKSVRNHRSCDQIIRTRQLPGILCAFAIFSVFPVQFTAFIEVSKKIFGENISDAMMAESLLIINCKQGLVNIYSLQNILAEYTLFESQLGQKCKHLGGNVGEFPYGLPVNVEITECPPVLFKVRCGENDLAIGGFPWQYIIQTIGNNNVFQVFMLDPPHHVEKGIMKYEMCHIEPDRALFHQDDSGRIIHYSSSELRVLKLVEMDGNYELLSLFGITFDAVSSKPDSVFSSSGRKLKRTFRDGASESLQRNLLSFHYEDEIDVLSVLVADPLGTSCSSRAGGAVHLYDNHVGTLIKTVQLVETWEEDAEHNLILDCDMLIHTVKNPKGQSSCYIYKFNRLETMEKLGEETVRINT